jgi:hypothetical protein
MEELIEHILYDLTELQAKAYEKYLCKEIGYLQLARIDIALLHIKEVLAGL